jgi:hypothetical protein
MGRVRARGRALEQLDGPVNKVEYKKSAIQRAVSGPSCSPAPLHRQWQVWDADAEPDGLRAGQPPGRISLGSPGRATARPTPSCSPCFPMLAACRRSVRDMDAAAGPYVLRWLAPSRTSLELADPHHVLWLSCCDPFFPFVIRWRRR